MIKNWMNTNLWTLLDIIVAASLLYFFSVINSEFINYPYMYTLDDLSDIDVVKRIIHPTSFTNFFETFLLKNPMDYHGFITLLIPGIIGFIPEIIWGDAGLLLTLRMLSTILPIIAYWLIANSVAPKKPLATILFVACLAFAGNYFFFVMPRVESYQLFFLSLFIYFQMKNNFSGNKSYIFLGLSLAARISIFPLVSLFFLCSFFYRSRTQTTVKSLFKRGGFLVLGYLVGQPHNLLPHNLFQFILRKKFQIFDDTGTSENVDFQWWMDTSLSHSFFHSYIFIFFLLTIVFVGIYFFHKFLKQNNTQDLFWAVASFASFLSLLLIINFMKLTYSHWYPLLHLVIGLTATYAALRHRPTPALLVAAISLSAIIISTRIPQSPTYINTHYDLPSMLKRSSDPMLQGRIRRHNKAKSILLYLEKKLKKQIIYKVDRNEYLPKLSGNFLYSLTSSATFFEEMHLPYDTIFHRTTEENANPFPEQGLVNYNHYLFHYNKYNELVSTKAGGKCTGASCFDRLKIETDYYVYAKKEIIKLIQANKKKLKL